MLALAHRLSLPGKARLIAQIAEVMIDVLRGSPPALAWLTSLGTARLALAGYVVMELTTVQPYARTAPYAPLTP